MIMLTDENFEKEVSSNSIVVVYFSATWCGPCRVYGPIFEEVGNKVLDVKMFKADVDSCPQSASKLSVTAVPTTMIFKNGQKVHVLTGVKQVEDLVSAIDSHR